MENEILNLLNNITDEEAELIMNNIKDFYNNDAKENIV